MNPAGLWFALALATGGLASLAALLIPEPSTRRVTTGWLTAAAGASGLIAGGAAIAGQTFTASLPMLLPLFGARLALDPLGGLFVAVTGAVAIATAVYGIGYTRHGLDGRVAQATPPLFVTAMLLVPAAASVGTFLICWELMALASLLLVVAEHRRRAEVAEAGLWYAVMTHLGLIAVLVGLAIVAAKAPNDGFDAIRDTAAGLSPAAQSVVFVTTFLGFASKAGAVPLHAWLPRAHPEAPSHVSALMSAAMVNLGVYGIVRIGFDLLDGGFRWWWLLVLATGAVSAVYGILQAAMSTDIKRLLAYSTTENMGLALIGVGAAGIFATTGHPVLAALALTAALLHLVNHAAFKTLLFLAAGSALRATGSRNLDTLGGLRVPMPATTAMFGLGALAATALPPGNAFVSEWLLLQSLIHGLPAGGTLTAITMPLAVAAIALTAGLAVATFVKAFGVGFLGKARGAEAARAAEAPPSMIAGMSVAAVAVVATALAPAFLTPRLAPAVAAASPGLAGPAVRPGLGLRLTGADGSLSPLSVTAALTVAILAAAVLVRAAATYRARRVARLWDCGAGGLSARMEYTATSFAEPLQRVFDDVLAPEQGVDVTHIRESRYLVGRVQYRHRVPDRIEARLYQPVLHLTRQWGQAGRQLATGSVHRYLGYGFATVLGLLVLLAVTR